MATGERLMIVSSSDQSERPIITGSFLQDWIAGHPELTTDLVYRVLGSGTRREAIFRAAFGELAPLDDIAQRFQTKPKNVTASLNSALRLLSEATHLPLAKDPSFVKGLQARILLGKCGQGDIGAASKLINLWPGTLTIDKWGVPEQERKEFGQRVRQKIVKFAPTLEWQGTVKLRNWLVKTHRTTAISFQRTRERKRETEEKLKQLGSTKSPRGPKDPLDDWLDQHPRKSKELISRLSPNQQLIINAIRQGLKPHEIGKRHFPDRSRSYVKVMRNLARNFLEKEAGIPPIPSGYQSQHQVRKLLGISAEIFRRDLQTGKIPDAEFRRGIFYLDPQKVAAYYGKQIPPDARDDIMPLMPERSREPDKRASVEVEREMVSRILQGDQEACDWLMDTYEKRLYWFFLTQTGSDRQAQKKTLEAFDHLPTILWGWLAQYQDQDVSLDVTIFKEVMDLATKKEIPFLGLVKRHKTLSEDPDNPRAVKLYQLSPDGHQQSSRMLLSLRFAAGLSLEKMALVLGTSKEELGEKMQTALSKLSPKSK